MKKSFSARYSVTPVRWERTKPFSVPNGKNPHCVGNRIGLRCQNDMLTEMASYFPGPLVPDPLILG